MKSLPDSWESLSLGDAVINIAITDKKIAQKAYLPEGRYPIFDQGQDYIGGYSDDKDKLVECELPVIIFGDHTRVVKFVNQPFAPGADGVKILQPQRFYVPRLLEYFTRHIATHLTSHGYARHYQHLVKSKIPLPPTNEQHRIVAKIEELFSELDKGIENLKTVREQLKVYRQALLKHAFEGKLTAQWREERRANSAHTLIPAQAGIHADQKLDPRLRGGDELCGLNDEPLETAAALLARIQTEREQRYQQQLQQWQTIGGSKPKAPKPLPPLTAEELAELPELPEGWGWATLESIIEEGPINGYSPQAVKFETGTRAITLTATTSGKFNGSHFKYINEVIPSESPLWLKPGDILVQRGNTIEYVGVPAIYKGSVNQFIYPDLIMKIRVAQLVEADYILFSMSGERARNYLRGKAVGAAGSMPKINHATLRSLPIPICSHLLEQQKIVQELESRLSEADQLDQTLTTSLQQSEALRQSILKKAFSGQLVAQDANDEPAAALLARIRAEKTQHTEKPKQPMSRSKRNE